MSTTIEWTDETWNPTTGCDRVSPGCDNCYALTMAKRLKGMGSAKYQTDGDPRTSGPGFGLAMHDDVLGQPLRWRKPRKVFVNSMSDLFHPKVPDEFIAQVWAVMALADRHTFQVLTKRPKRMRALLTSATWRHAALRYGQALAGDGQGWLRAGRVLGPAGLPNVWLGTSVEDQQRADERIPALLDTPAAVRFLSCEPLLGPVDLAAWTNQVEITRLDVDHDLVARRSPGIGWVIVGGESGPGARPMHPQWARDLRDQANAAGVPYLFKQHGAWVQPHDDFGPDADEWVAFDGTRSAYRDGPPPPEHGIAAPMARVGKHAAGRELDGRTWDQFPAEVPADA